MRKMPALAAALLTVSLALAGCSSDGSADQASAKSKADAPADARQEAAVGAGGSERDGKAAAEEGDIPTGTYVIRTAQLSVEVDDAQKALGTARAAAGRAGGIVENESTERVEDDHVSSTITLRVPQDSYDEVLRELAGTGKLLNRTSNAKDVTDKVVDTDSRVATQRASVARVRELMDRATKLSDVVALEGELSNRQAALESLLARQASLKDRTSLATVTLHLSEVPAKEAEKKEEDDPGFLDALDGGWNVFLGTLRWISVVFGAVVPFAVALVVLYLLWRLVRDRLLRRPAPRREGPPEQD